MTDGERRECRLGRMNDRSEWPRLVDKEAFERRRSCRKPQQGHSADDCNGVWDNMPTVWAIQFFVELDCPFLFIFPKESPQNGVYIQGPEGRTDQAYRHR